MTKYTIFIGLNDKDTKAQEISTLDAYKIASNLAVVNLGFATITESKGVYTHDDGSIVEETTLRCEVTNAKLENVKAFCVACKNAFNQESVALEVSKVDFSFV